MAELSQTRKRDNYVSRWLWNALGVAGDQQSLWRPPLLRELRDSIIASAGSEGVMGGTGMATATCCPRSWKSASGGNRSW